MIRSRGYRPILEDLDPRWVPSGLSPWAVQQAYGMHSVTVTGQGQTIAIVDAYHDPYLASDLATFDTQFGLPGQSASQLASTLSVVNLAGNRTDSGWAGEEALDVEWAHAMAPGAKIVVVEAASSNLNDLMAAVNVARNISGVSVVTMSWGASEFSSETAYDSYFTTPAGHTPITFVASSGDTGAWGGTEWPSSSPNVVSVGGTTLYTNSATGAIQYETGWSGSGGGVSRYEAQPSYQASVQATGRRTTPDVSLDADPNTGLYTYITDTSTGRGSWEIVGGTSASAQLFGGVLAVADQVRAIFGKGTLDTGSTLSALYSYSSSIFNDITTGVNGYRAGYGYDLVTGLGSPKAYQLFVNLYKPGSLTATAAKASTATTHASASTHSVTTTSTTAAATTAGAASTDTTVAVAAPTMTAASSLTASPTTTTGSSSSSASLLSTVQAPASQVNPVPQPLTRGAASALPVPMHESSGSQVKPPEDDAEAWSDTDEESRARTQTGSDASSSSSPSGGTTRPSLNAGGDAGEIMAPLPDATAPEEDSQDDAPLSAAALIDAALRYYPAELSGLGLEPERPEEVSQVSCLGAAAVALAATVYQSRRDEPVTAPRGPRELFRTSWEAWLFTR